MENINLTLTFSNTSPQAAAEALKSAEIIIPHFSFAAGSADLEFKATVLDTTLISFTGMMKDFCNRSKASVVMVNGAGGKVEIGPVTGEYHFADVEKQVKVLR